jgi:hypothetical protein
MVDLTFDQLLQAVQRLTDEQKAILRDQLWEETHTPVSRESLIAELQALRASGAFENVESLRNAFYTPAMESLTTEQLLADLHRIATEWEQELDEFFGDDN